MHRSVHRGWRRGGRGPEVSAPESLGGEGRGAEGACVVWGWGLFKNSPVGAKAICAAGFFLYFFVLFCKILAKKRVFFVFLLAF